MRILRRLCGHASVKHPTDAEAHEKESQDAAAGSAESLPACEYPDPVKVSSKCAPDLHLPEHPGSPGNGRVIDCSAHELHSLEEKKTSAAPGGTNLSSVAAISESGSTPPTPTVRRLPASRYLPEYVVERTLGYGSSGKVCLCRRPGSPGDLYALKELRNTANSSAVRRTKKSSLMRNSLSEGTFAAPDPVAGERFACGIAPHDNVLRVHEIVPGGDEQNAKVVMEAALGGDATCLDLHPGGALDERRLAGLLSDVLKGLEHLRGLGVVHGDLKPGNLVRPELRSRSSPAA